MAVNPFGGIIQLNTFHLYPIIYLNAVTAKANIDPKKEEASALGVWAMAFLAICIIGVSIILGKNSEQYSESKYKIRRTLKSLRSRLQ